MLEETTPKEKKEFIDALYTHCTKGDNMKKITDEEILKGMKKKRKYDDGEADKYYRLMIIGMTKKERFNFGKRMSLLKWTIKSVTQSISSSNPITHSGCCGLCFYDDMENESDICLECINRDFDCKDYVDDWESMVKDIKKLKY